MMAVVKMVEWLLELLRKILQLFAGSLQQLKIRNAVWKEAMYLNNKFDVLLLIIRKNYQLYYETLDPFHNAQFLWLTKYHSHKTFAINPADTECVAKDSSVKIKSKKICVKNIWNIRQLWLSFTILRDICADKMRSSRWLDER